MISVVKEPRLKNQAWKKPLLIPVYNKTVLTGPIGAANDAPNTRYINIEFKKQPSHKNAVFAFYSKTATHRTNNRQS